MTEKTHDYVAFFDLDDTILSTSSGKLFIQYCYEHGMYNPLEIGDGLLTFAGYGLGILSADDVVRKWARAYKGWPQAKLADLMNTIFDHSIKHHIRDAAVAEIEKHRRDNARVVMLSASTPFVCGPVQELLQMHDLICTQLKVDGSERLTGELDGDYVYGRFKLVHATAYCEKHDFQLKDAFYYGDSHADRFVLSGVGNAFCINPGTRLTNLANEKQWKILNW